MHMTKTMREESISVVFLFDARYLGAALTSAANLIEVLGASRVPVTLVYLVGTGSADAKVAAILQRFEAGVRCRYPEILLQTITLQGNIFSDYVKRYHFSEAILYKVILPKVLKAYRHLLVLDCGMIFGNRLINFLDGVEMSIRSSEMAPVAAFCVPADQAGGLGDDLKHHPHNALLPGAAILYFDVVRYEQLALYERLLSGFQAHRERLAYAEQDLMCLVLTDRELGVFTEGGVRCHIDMAGQASWKAIDDYEALYASGDFLYLKHVGSFKPWKKWVLHPAKSIFLREQNKLGSLIGSESLADLHDPELFPDHLGFLEQQLLSLEAYLENNRE